MLSFFTESPDRVRWELVQVSPTGPYRLAIHHAQGVILETFKTAAMAVRRIQEVEELLMVAKGVRLSALGAHP